MKVALLTALLLAVLLDARRTGGRRRQAKRESVTDRTQTSTRDVTQASDARSDREMRAPKLVLDERTTVEDLRRLHRTNCRNITVSLLSKVPPEACYGLELDCLIEFNTTNLSPSCLMNISWSTMKNLGRKTFHELMNSDAEHMFFSLEDISSLLGHHGKFYDQFPSTFVAYCSSDPIFAESYAATLVSLHHTTGLTQLFSLPYLEHLDASVFRYVDERVMKSMDPITFRHIKKEQLAWIPAMAFTSMTPAQFSSIPPAHFEVFNADSLLLMPASCIAALTAQQAKNLGADPSKPPEVKSQSKAQRDLEIFSRRVFIDRHACVAVQERRQHIKSEAVWDALKVRCDLVWNGYGPKQLAMKRTAPDSSASTITAHTGLFAIMLAILII